MKQKVLILGAGFGGLELATRLSQTMADEVDITLIDKNDFFILGFAKLDVLFCAKRPEKIKSYYRNLLPAIRFRQEQIQSVDPENRRVVTNANTYSADILVVALGADLDVERTPGLAQHGHEFYSLPGVERLSGVLAKLQSGVALISILG